MLMKRSKRVSKHGKEILFKIKQIFDDNDVFFWLEFGTLLGAYRERGFIKHEDDIDLGVMITDAANVQNILEKNGFRLFKKSMIKNVPETVAQLQGYRYKKIPIDFYFFATENDKLYCYTFPELRDNNNNQISQTINGVKSYKARVKTITFPYNGFETIDFMGEKFNVPSKTDIHLGSLYGPTFMTPMRKSTYKVSGVHYFPIEEKEGIVTKFY